IKKAVQNLKVLTSYRAIILVFGYALSKQSSEVFQVMIPFKFEAEGHSLETAAWCLFIASIGNVISRVTNSALSDQRWFNMQLVYVIGILLTTISMLVFSLTSDMMWRKVLMSVFGYGTGIILTLQNLVMVE
ncbi:unnamed protein product, partial [Meganyctiphanes norvegica]